MGSRVAQLLTVGLFGVMSQGCPRGRPPGPAVSPPASSGHDVLLPLVRQRVLEAYVAAMRGDFGEAHARLGRARGLTSEVAALDAVAQDIAKMDALVPESAAGSMGSWSTRALISMARQAPSTDVAPLAVRLDTDAARALAPAAVLVCTVRAAARQPVLTADWRRRVRDAALAVGDLPRLSRYPADGPAGAGYPPEDSAGPPVVPVPDAAAPAWSAYVAGRPAEARTLLEAAHQHSADPTALVDWMRLIEGIPGEARLVEAW